jgi:hypothetical protein
LLFLPSTPRLCTPEIQGMIQRSKTLDTIMYVRRQMPRRLSYSPSYLARGEASASTPSGIYQNCRAPSSFRFLRLQSRGLTCTCCPRYLCSVCKPVFCYIFSRYPAITFLSQQHLKDHLLRVASAALRSSRIPSSLHIPLGLLRNDIFPTDIFGSNANIATHADCPDVNRA